MTEQKRRGPYPKPIEVERRRVVGEHTHRQPRWPIVTLSLLFIVTAAAVVVLAFYVVGLTTARDAQVERTRDQVIETVCEVLDTLPESRRLDPVRDKYDCGPGVPRTDIEENP